MAAEQLGSGWGALFPALGRWLRVPDGTPEALRLYRRHYSCRQRRGRSPPLLLGPGEKMVLITPAGDALCAFRRFRNDDLRFGDGVNCAVFRNESQHRSSDLIREAVDRHARQRWPGQRLYTYVDPRAIRSSNPGCCFKLAGWRRCGTTRGGLTVLELLPRAAVARPARTVADVGGACLARGR